MVTLEGQPFHGTFDTYLQKIHQHIKEFELQGMAWKPEPGVVETVAAADPTHYREPLVIPEQIPAGGLVGEWSRQFVTYARVILDVFLPKWLELSTSFACECSVAMFMPLMCECRFEGPPVLGIPNKIEGLNVAYIRLRTRCYGGKWYYHGNIPTPQATVLVFLEHKELEEKYRRGERVVRGLEAFIKIDGENHPFKRGEATSYETY